jgi:hypothetical protein
MASEILGLFTSPQQYETAQDDAMRQRAMSFARLSPMEQAQYGFARAGQQAGRAIGSLLGGQDPQLKIIANRNRLASSIDPANPESIFNAAQQAASMGDQQFAMSLADYGRQAQSQLAELRSRTATAAKTELSVAQEEKLRSELSKLGPNPTNEEVLAVMSQFGPPEKILALLQSTQIATAQRDLRKEESKAKLEQRQTELADKAAQRERELELEHQRKLEELRQRGANAKELQAQRLADKRELEAQRAADRKEARDLAQASKPLPPGIQKAEDADYDAATAAINLANDADKYLNSITSGGIKFGLKDKLSIAARSALGSNDPEVVARNDFERFKTTLVNESLRLNKGTQTEGDAARAAKELQGAESAADAAKAIQTLRDLNVRRAGDSRDSIDRRRANSKLPSVEVQIEVPKFEPRVFTNADYAALPKGTVFIDDKGVRRKKP